MTRPTFFATLALLIASSGSLASPAVASLGWLRAGAATTQAIAMIQVLKAADAYGLRPEDYVPPAALQRGAHGEQPPAAAQLDFDQALSFATRRFLHDLHCGRVDPRAVGFDLGRPRPPLDLPVLLAQLQTTDDVARVVASVEPRFLHYRLLREALARYRRLQAGAALPTPAEARSAPYALRIRQIELTLERWRWLPEFDSPPIIVNIPQFRLFAFRSTEDRKAQILQMGVIVGRTFAAMQTPVFVADLRYVIFRPYWDIPFSITRREMLPALRKDPHYAEREHLELVRGEGDEAPVVAFGADSLELLAAGKLRLRQRPGNDNALGLIKFVLPNSYNVYLHSTPARQLFARSRRAFSHGCIRVSDPVALAALVLSNAPGDWTPSAIEAAMNGPDDVRVNLTRPIRVLILYGTALATEDGSVLFFDDLYGHDRKLEHLLGLPPLPGR